MQAILTRCTACKRLLWYGQKCVCQNLDRERNAGIGAAQMRKKAK